MRATIALLLATAACGGSAPEAKSAATAAAASSSSPGLDVSSVKDRMRLWTDGQSHTVAVVEPDPENPVPRELSLFWLDHGTFYQVPVNGAYADGLKFDIGFEDVRVPSRPAGSVKREGGKTVLSCWGTDAPLTRVPAADADKLLAGAKFVANHSRWQPVALGKINERYLYVDSGALPENHAQYRVFEGEKGAMRAVDVVEARWDEHSNVLTIKTKDRTLRVTRDDNQKREYTLKPAWDGKKEDWSSMARAENWRFIYEGLGVYGADARTPTPCDPMLEKP